MWARPARDGALGYLHDGDHEPSLHAPEEKAVHGPRGSDGAGWDG